jgi:S-adenosyl-L-methionine hydrolase (adenosine-forming)
MPLIDALHDAPDFGIEPAAHHRAGRCRCWRIAWRPARLSASFHGRDLFAPVAAALATRRILQRWLSGKSRPDVLLADTDLGRVIYIDHYGNAVTGLRANPKDRVLSAGGRRLRHARTFEEATGPFWYENSMGLVEIAAPRASAARALRLKIGSRVAWRR